MTIAEMLQQSAVLTLLGMIVVFAFLWLMIICVNGVGRLVHLLGWDTDLREQKKEPEKGAAGGMPSEVIAAITAAVTEYRKKGRNPL
jgi:oxaloacetate decarboxylase gamma subunit